MLHTKNILKAILNGESIEHYPIWIMRQAGRYLPEYLALRKQYSFLEACRNPEIAAEISIQPIRRFDLDFIIVFSDILLPLADYGYDIDFPETGGISVKYTGEIPEQQININATCDAIKLINQYNNDNHNGEKAIIGFCGGVWTLASYILEGGSKKNNEFYNIKKALYTEPEKLHILLDNLTDYMIDYLQRQIASGVNMIQIFESWAGELPPQVFDEYVAPRLKRLTDSLPADTVKTFYMKNTALYLDKVMTLGFDVLSIDWKHDLAATWARLKNNPQNTVKALQGNLDPDILTIKNDELLIKEVNRIKNTAKNNQINLIFNLGHGITPQAMVDNVDLFCNTVHAD